MGLPVSEEGVERRLTTIVAADVVGYSRLMAADEAGTLAQLKTHRKRVPQSQRYYEKKRAEGKRHNQAISALGRHLCRVIFKMLSQERSYRTEPRQITSIFLFKIPAGCSDSDSLSMRPDGLLPGMEQT